MKDKYLFYRKSLIALLMIPFFTSIGVSQVQTPIGIQPTITKNHELSVSTLNLEEPPSDFSIEPCVTDALMDKYLIENNLKEGFQAAYQEALNDIDYSDVGDKAQYTIPVIFHVVYNTNAQNVSNAKIMAIFNQLNLDFQLQNSDRTQARSQYGFTPSNANIDFCLAEVDPQGNPLAETGVVRVQTNVTWWNYNTNENGMKSATTGGSTIWDRKKYLNVWIVNISNGANSGVAGYAYLGSTNPNYLPSASIDGVVIDYHLGTYAAGRTLTHEVGHYLGLPHTWGNVDGQGCSNGNDGIADTPNTAGPSFNYSGSCQGNQQTCSGTQTQYENFMDYSNCYCMFTAGQTNLMRNVLTQGRATLLNSDVCQGAAPVTPVADFTANVTTIGVGGIVNFTDLSTNYPTNWSWSISPASGWSYTGGTNASSQNPRVQFNNPGYYTVSLTASNSAGQDTETKNQYIHVVDNTGQSNCDTLRNYTLAELEDATAYIFTDENGYYPGNSTLNDGAIRITGMAERMTSISSNPLRAIRFWVIHAVDRGPSNNITFKILNDNNGMPGATSLATETRQLASLDQGDWNIIEFNNPTTVNGNFWISIEWTNGSVVDTITFATTNFSDRPNGQGTSAFRINNNWYTLANIFQSPPNSSMIIDALFGNGPAPIASMTINPQEVCENSLVTVSGSNSSNASNYDWKFKNSSGTYIGAGENLSFTNLPVGTWTVELSAGGNCLVDVASGTLKIDPSITRNTNKTDDFCNQSNGSITINNVQGGAGGPYSVSINGGAAYTSTTPFVFNGLSAGTYNTIVKDNVCADTVDITINSINNFNPSVTPGTTVTINAGNSTTLSVTGGTSWKWYISGQSTPFATTQSVTVSPTTTTVYTVLVEDGNGCSETFEITVYVNGTSGIANDVLNKGFNIYPNPSNGKFNIDIHLDKSQKIQLAIYNIMGEVVYSESYNNQKEIISTIDLSEYNNGAYIIKVISEDEIFTQKIVINK